jgi:hypothetical protein
MDMKNLYKLIVICATGLIFISPTSLWAAKSLNHSTPKTNTALLGVNGSILGSGPPPPTITPAFAISNDGSGVTWTSIGGLPPTGQVNVVTCSGNNAIGYCVAAGIQPSVGSYILASNDAGNTFNPITVPGLAGNITSGSCVANNCVLTVEGASGAPVIVAENGSTGYLSTLTGFPATGALSSSSCVGPNGTGNSTCVAVGTSNSLPILGVSTDTGATWGIDSITGVPVNASLNAVSCTGLVGSATCVAVGQNVTALVPMAILSNDGAASTWSVLSLPALATNAGFSDVSCTGTGSTAICAAVGASRTGVAFLYASVDGGVTWTKPAVPGMPTSGNFFGVSCTGSGSNAVCMAVGQDQSSTSAAPPLLISSTDGGVTWAIVHIPGMAPNGYYRSVACTNATNTTSAAVCTITGLTFASSGSGGMQVTTSDSGATWTIQSMASSTSYFASTATG